MGTRSRRTATGTRSAAEIRPVGGLTNGTRGNGLELIDLEPIRDLLEASQGGKGQLDGLRIEPARGIQGPSEPGGFSLFVENPVIASP